MTSETALTVRQNLTIDEMSRVALAMSKSGYFEDAKDVSKAMVKVLAGNEIGLGPFASMTGIHVIKGKPVLGSNVIATLVKNDPRYNYRVATCNDEYCCLIWYESGKEVGKSDFSINEAEQARLTDKDNWRMYPSDMLFARALTRGARRYAPGIFGGAPVYTPDELGAAEDEDGNILEGELVQDEPLLVEPTGNAPSPPRKPQAKVNGSKPEAKEAPPAALPFHKAMANDIPYFHAPQHVAHTMNLLGMEYPKDKDEAGGCKLVLEAYANLRADGMTQDEAVFEMLGKAHE